MRCGKDGDVLSRVNSANERSAVRADAHKQAAHRVNDDRMTGKDSGRLGWGRLHSLSV